MFELATPWALLALPLPLILWFCLPRATTTSISALNIPFFDRLSLIQPAKTEHPILSFIALLFIWSLLIVALSGPRWVGEPRPLSREGHNIMLILDISGSMEIQDHLQNGRPATRLSLVKSAAEMFIKNRPGDQLGLILFGTRAYLQTPLTHDHASILMRLKDATVGLAGKTTSIGDALGLAVKHMQHVPAKGRVIILLTDGANNTGALPPLKAAKIAQTDGIKVYTIGLGSSNRAIQRYGSIPVMADDLDENTLKTIASMTHGRYFRATNKRSLDYIYQLINQLETVPQSDATVRPEIDYYVWPLTLALLCFILWLIHNTAIFHRKPRFMHSSYQKEHA